MTNAHTSAPDMPPDIRLVVNASGYSEPRKVAGQGWCALLQFNFTWGLVVGLSTSTYERRYCYEHHDDAVDALHRWDGVDHPTGPWIKCKGAGIDLLNPALDVSESPRG